MSQASTYSIYNRSLQENYAVIIREANALLCTRIMIPVWRASEARLSQVHDFCKLRYTCDSSGYLLHSIIRYCCRHDDE